MNDTAKMIETLREKSAKQLSNMTQRKCYKQLRRHYDMLKQLSNNKHARENGSKTMHC